MNTNKAFKCGSNAALDAMDVLGKTFDGKHNAYAKDALAGSLKELMLAVYAMAPDEETAEELISLNHKITFRNIEEMANV